MIYLYAIMHRKQKVSNDSLNLSNLTDAIIQRTHKRAAEIDSYHSYELRIH